MDAPTQRPSASRASRLPVPRASAIPRPTFSTAVPSSPAASPAHPSLAAPTGPAGTHELHNPKVRKSLGGTPLRAAGSREQLRTASISRPLAQRPAGNRVSSNAQRRTSLFVDRVPSRASTATATDRDGDDLAGSRRASRAGLLPDDYDTSPLQEHTPYSPIEDGTYMQAPTTQSRKPRPSLSERAMETLANIPSSPAMNRKPSSFFDQARPRSRSGSVSSRPGSSYNSDGSGRPQSRSSSRPGSRAENDGYSGAYKSALSTIDGTPERAKARAPIRTPNSRISMKPSLTSASKPLPVARSPSPDKQHTQPVPKSRSAPAKSLKSKASSNGLFKKPALPATSRNVPSSEAADQLWDGGIAPLKITKNRVNTSEDRPGLAHRKSSAALRDQIAKAKAARKASAKLDSPSNTDFAPISIGDRGLGFGVEDHPDPFGQNKNEPAGAKVLQQRIATGRTTGRLNIAALGLKEMPIEVLNMYNLDSMSGGGSWAESVDLTRLVAADNAFETLDDVLFPDTIPDEFDMDIDDDVLPNIFGGLETMDFHGNILAAVPIGFRRLSQLTSLNLSKNNLDNKCLQILSQMTALRDLKLASNNISGPLNAAISLLDGLELLDLHDNKISSLPQDMYKMTRLRILDLGENNVEAISFADIADLPLSQLVLRKNKLTGTLIEAPIEAMRTLQTLDVSCNQIKYLMPSATVISFPALHTLSVSMNRLQELPDMSSWSSLLTLTLDENGITAIPESFMSLTKLRQVDFSGNDIRVVPPELSRMDSLSMIRLSGNPLRDKKFVTASTDELKEILAGRLEPPPPYQEQSENVVGLIDKYQATTRHFVDDDAKSDAEDDFTTPPTSRPHSPSRSRSQTMDSIQTQFHMPVLEDWQVRAGGVLDRSRTGSSVLDATKCTEANDKQTIRQLLLHHNLFSAFPDSLAIVARSLTSLSLANNQLTGATYLRQPLELPALKELNLTANRITSLEPLLEHLDAPFLETLDISTNRLTGLPSGLLEKFPRLRVLLASHNQISELRPDSIKGLKIIEVASNEIGQLDPRLGLLGGVNGLERLDVSGNRFKVPRWNILEQGTHATLHWLRGRVPEEEMERWREQNGDDD